MAEEIIAAQEWKKYCEKKRSLSKEPYGSKKYFRLREEANSLYQAYRKAFEKEWSELLKSEAG